MNCSEAEVYVSSLYDREEIPEDAARHITACAECRRTLTDYSRMGAELRLTAIKESGQLPPLRLPSQYSRFAFLRRRIAIPRFALAGLIGCTLFAVTLASMVRAQSNPQWFEFGYSLQRVDPFNYMVAKQGFDQQSAASGFLNGQLVAVALRTKVERISKEDVVLRVRAVSARTQVTATGVKLLGDPPGGISLVGVRAVHYRPGVSLPIPIEGGGTVYLKGDVLDHQPEIAFRSPLVPPPDKMNIRSPALFGSNKLIGELRGASAIAHEPGGAVLFSGPQGTFAFALHPFPGAVQGEANWGQLTFKLGGESYRLLAAAPITGGDQPRTVWVRHDVHPYWGPHCDQTCLGSGPAPN